MLWTNRGYTSTQLEVLSHPVDIYDRSYFCFDREAKLSLVCFSIWRNQCLLIIVSNQLILRRTSRRCSTWLVPWCVQPVRFCHHQYYTRFRHKYRFKLGLKASIEVEAVKSEMTEKGMNFPSQNVFNEDGVIFSSNFDNGNLAKVLQLKSSMPYDYKVWVAPDNHGTALLLYQHIIASFKNIHYHLRIAITPSTWRPYKINFMLGTSYQSKHNAWFHFMVSGIPKGNTLRIQVANASNHAGLYKFDMVRSIIIICEQFY